MPGPKPPEIELTDEARQGLEKLVRRHNTPQQVALRARIVLAAADGRNNSQIAKKLEISVPTARLWRNRWLLLQPISGDDLSIEEQLEDLPRPGAPAEITAEQRCQIEAMACEDPEDSGRPSSLDRRPKRLFVLLQDRDTVPVAYVRVLDHFSAHPYLLGNIVNVR